jgi:uncharacterized protein
VYVSDDDLRAWARGIIDWRVHPKWYVAAIGIPAAIGFGSALLADLLGGPIDFEAFSPALTTLAIGVVLGTFIGGGQEEIGWRGFVQPELQQRYSGLTTAIIIDIVWGLWHLPLFLDPFALPAQWPLLTQVAWFVGLLGFSILLSWVYNGTGGSILLAMVMHGSINALPGALVPLDVDLVVVDSVVDWSALVVVGAVGTGLLARRTASSEDVVADSAEAF